MADQSSEKTLDSTVSSSDQPQSTDSPVIEADSSGSLSRNSSFSKLNAQAPEFVPKKTNLPSPTSITAGDPRVLIVPPPPTPPPAMVHVYPPPPPPQVNSPFPVMPLPHMNHHHHHHPHHHHHQQNYHDHHNNHRNDSHRNHHHKHHHQSQFHGGSNGEQQEGVGQGSNQQDKDQGQGNNGGSRNINGLSEESTQKLINQVEYYFSDVNLATTDHLIKFINKDPEGFVPISVVASFKKIKALISSNSQLAAVLRNSTKLVVSEDGKKVKRVHSLSGSDMEELQARIIVAENLPEDHCHQNLMKVFSTVGSVKSIRTCQPQPSNNGASSASRQSKADNGIYSNKLHAFVEYESIELAEKAISELNQEGDWRNGLRVRPLLKHGSKTVQTRGKKSGNEGEVTCDEEDTSTSELKQNEKHSEDPSGQPDIVSHDHTEEQSVEKEGGQKKSRNRGRGKGRGRGHHNHQQNNRMHHVGSPPVINVINGEHPIVAKQQPPGPRMPDGTRGFSMGRGRPVAVNTAA
ncbi:la-related protein 6B-like isoform X1 [Amaranthus tricolor]|uniref:la-related protein 6B-like isoform X1 n=1 Tax=Amaranthus tricolor TaxID=29722 RepID=UPI0025844D90|nr:la-related protein 6B-like isoform X1 [Amaranthus tricolor]